MEQVANLNPSSLFNRTRIQRATALKGETAWSRVTKVSAEMFREEGPAAFYKGITPRVARVAPGQAVVFAVSSTSARSSIYVCADFAGVGRFTSESRLGWRRTRKRRKPTTRNKNKFNSRVELECETR